MHVQDYKMTTLIEVCDTYQYINVYIYIARQIACKSFQKNINTYSNIFHILVLFFLMISYVAHSKSSYHQFEGQHEPGVYLIIIIHEWPC